MSRNPYDPLPEGVGDYVGVVTIRVREGTYRLHQTMRRIGYYRLLAPAAAILALLALRLGWLPIK